MTVMDGNIVEMHRSALTLDDLDKALQQLRASLQEPIDTARAQWVSAGSAAAFDRLVIEYDNDLAQIKQEMLRQAAAHEFSNMQYAAAEDESQASLTAAAGSSSGGMQAAINPTA
jgi:hypothetical protein